MEAAGTMACVGTGKIKETTGLRDALDLVRSKTGVSEGILRIISQEASGRIAVRGGRFIIGAHIGGSGLTGYPALKTFLALKRGMYYYLEGEEAGGLADLEQSLGVDIDPLILASSHQEIVATFSALAQESGWDCVTEVYAAPTSGPHVQYSPPDEPGSANFGDNFLDKIAWAAKSTWQRLQTLGRRNESQEAQRVFQDIENALSHAGNPDAAAAAAQPDSPTQGWWQPGGGQQKPPQRPAQQQVRPFGMPAGDNMQTVQAQAPQPVQELVERPGQQPASTSRLFDRDVEDRAKSYTERTTDSQRLRMMDIDEAIKESDSPAALKQRRSNFDGASLGMVAVTVGLFVVGYFAFRTITYMYSGDEYLRRAEKYMKDGKPELAVNEYTFALDKKPDDPKLLALRAAVFESGGEYQNALRDYDAIAVKKPEDVDIALHRAMIRCRLCQFNEAMSLTGPVLRKQPDNGNALGLHGMALAGVGQYKEALEHLNRISDDTKLVPYLVASVNGARGFSYLKLNQPKEALQIYQSALKLQPQNDSLHREIAECHYALKDFDAAIAELNRAVELAPGSLWNYVELAKVCDQTGDYETAVRAYKDAIKLERHPAELYLKLAADQLKLGRNQEALVSCDLVLQLMPNHKEAQRIRAEVLAKDRSPKTPGTSAGNPKPSSVRKK